MSGSNDEIANTAGPASSAEPSMEEILASIRRILKDDQAPESAEPEDEILVLDSTMVVKPGTGVAREAEAALAPATVEPVLAEPEPEPAPEIEPVAGPGPLAEFPQPEPVIEEPAAEPEYVADPHLSSELPPISDFDIPLVETPVHELTLPDTTEMEPAGGASQAEMAATEPMEDLTMPDDNHENIQRPDGLVSDSAREAAAGSIGALIRSISSDRSIAVGRPGLTLEDLVREELRPLLKSWLDSNLPALVERIVRAEIQRVIERSTV